MTKIVACTLAFATGFLLLTLAFAYAEALPYEKGRGQCAGSYVQSASYCIPKAGNSAPAIPKRGSCPSGWFQSGGSCQKMR